MLEFRGRGGDLLADDKGYVSGFLEEEEAH